MSTLEKHLESFREKDEANKDLVSAWSILKRMLVDNLSSIERYFPHYSKHDASHSVTIIRNIEKLLGDNRIDKLGVSDTFMLLLSAYAHDIGMLIPYDDFKAIWEKDDFKIFIENLGNDGDSIVREYIEVVKKDNIEEVFDHAFKEYQAVIMLTAAYARKKHPENSKIFIDKNVLGVDFSIGNMIPSRIIDLLGDICKLHGKSCKDIMELSQLSDGIVSDYMHPRFIAMMLRLGDVLDVDNNRFKDNLDVLTKNLPYETVLNINKHRAVKHLLISTTAIEITSECKDIDTAVLILNWRNWLENDIKFLLEKWNVIMPNDFASVFPLPEFIITINGKYIEDCMIKNYNIDEKRINDLIVGSVIYGDDFVFIRELLQNAEDASRLKLWQVLSEKAYTDKILPNEIDEELLKRYEINVKVTLKNNSSNLVSCRFEVSDKGVGISSDDFRNMSKIRKSWQDRPQWNSFIKTMPIWMKPVGGFGMGLHSVFRISDNITYITKSSEEKTKKITMRSFGTDGAMLIEDSEDVLTETGTKAIVNIGENKLNKLIPVDQDEMIIQSDNEYRIRKISELLDKMIIASLFPIHISVDLEEEK